MSNRVFKGNLSTDSIQDIINQLNEYVEVDLPMMADTFVRKLAEIGIEVAKYEVHQEFQPYIEFKYIPITVGAGNLTAWDIEPIHRIWYNKKGEVIGEADVSPILMSEFGAGKYAIEGHRGTFPNQKNAFRSVWYWYDESGTKHSSDEDPTIIPTQPLYKAFAEMVDKVDAVAREVFGAYGNE